MSKHLVFRILPPPERWWTNLWEIRLPPSVDKQWSDQWRLLFSRKRDAVQCAQWLARGCGQPAQVVIHGRDGKIQREYTYPRSSDPRPKPGSRRDRR